MPSRPPPPPAADRLQGARPDATGIVDRLRSGGGRVTRPRRVIIDVLVELDDEHPTAADIVAGARAIDPSLHESTIYRTLDRLAELGVIEPLAPAERAVTYHLADHGHLHLVCDGCEATIEGDLTLLDPLATSLLEHEGFALRPTHTTLHGRCPTCREAKA